MSDYKRINFEKVALSQIMDEYSYKRLLQVAEEYKQANQDTYRIFLGQYNELRILADAIWPQTSKENRYIRNANVPKPPDFSRGLATLERRRNAEIKRIEQVEKSRASAARTREKTKEAVADLLAAGFEEWKDFSPYRAITERVRLMVLVEGEWVKKPNTFDEKVKELFGAK